MRPPSSLEQPAEAKMSATKASSAFALIVTVPIRLLSSRRQYEGPPRDVGPQPFRSIPAIQNRFVEEFTVVLGEGREVPVATDGAPLGDQREERDGNRLVVGFRPAGLRR